METRATVFIATFAAITAALAVFPPMTLPVVGVPITAQSLGAILAGGVLGARRGGLSMILFLILVAIGLPLLSGGRGGFGVFMGPTGGFLLGWVVTAVVVGLLMERLWQRLGHVTAFLASAAGGIVVLYGIGIPWSAAVALPFLPGDIIKCVIAATVIVIVRKSYPIITPAGRQASAVR